MQDALFVVIVLFYSAVATYVSEISDADNDRRRLWFAIFVLSLSMIGNTGTDDDSAKLLASDK